MPYPFVLAPDKQDPRYWTRIWEDCTVFIIGAGPGANHGLLARINSYAYAHNCPVVAVNSMFMHAKWADVLFFNSRAWWQRYQLSARRAFDGRLVSVVNAADPKVMAFRNQRFKTYGNAGADALSLANFLGARRAVLVGFDGPQAQPLHCHPPHPAGIEGTGSEQWPAAMAAVAQDIAKTTEVFSLSDGYGCFQSASLDTLLDDNFGLCSEKQSELLKRLHSSKPVVRHAVSVQPRPKTNKILTPEDIRLASWKDRWKGRTAFVLASGPSLTLEDVGAVERYSGAYNCPVVVTNTTFKLALWADLLFFHDKKWWQVYGSEVERDFQGLCVTMSRVTSAKVLSLQGKGFNAYRNSGGGAINFALLAGASTVITLGLDGKYASDGRRHWHKQDPSLGDANSLPRFVQYFPTLAKDAKAQGARIINASRETGLTCFPRVSLEDVLSSVPQPC